MFVAALVCFLGMATLMTPTDGNECVPKWFGPHCEFRCRCQRDSLCDKAGNCLFTDVCQKNYFGPACQYVDLASLAGDLSNSKYLVDHNESTCNPSSELKSARLELLSKFTITWFRMVFKNLKNKLDFRVTFNNNSQVCEDEHRFWKANTVDVSCSKAVILKTLYIHGNFTSSLCSLHISGGRNMALKQLTKQPDSDLPPNANISTLAVDGYSDSGPNGACVQLGRQNRSIDWVMTFRHVVRLSYILIYFRNSPGQPVKEFNLQMFNNTGNMVRKIPDLKPASGHIFKASIFEDMPILSVTISRTNSSTNLSSFVEVCEVETYGDIVCPHGYFGLQCKQQCSCKANESCSPVTGRCSAACQDGFYGTDCVNPCSSSCLDRLCHLASGYCLSCPPGYKGDVCTTECTSGTYGINCSQNCPSNCTDKCDNIDGQCRCLPGYVNHLCKGCFDGLYGPHCNLSCSENCALNKCHSHTAKCEQCVPWTAGPDCNDCASGRYGPRCLFNCSRNCAEDCDSVLGHCACNPRFLEPYCNDCELGFYGDGCDLPCSALCEHKLCDKVTGVCLDCGRTRLGRMCEVHRMTPPWTNYKSLFIVAMIVYPMIICGGIYCNRYSRRSSRGMHTYMVNRNVSI